MSVHTLHREQFIARPLEDVFRFFADAANLSLITPPWLSFQVLTPPPIQMEVGTRIDYKIGWRFVPIRWTSEIAEWEPNRRFTDVQIRGPYKLWHHTHNFDSAERGTLMTDNVDYELPLGPLGSLAHKLKVRNDLNAIFKFRAKQIKELLEVQPTSQVGSHSKRLVPLI